MRLAYIIGTYPSLTTTFIDREIRILRSWGVEIKVVAVRRPPNLLSPEQAQLQRDTAYLLPVSVLPFLAGHLRFALKDPAGYFGTLFHLLTRSHAGLKSRWMTLLHFVEGVWAAEVLRTCSCEHIHAHFMDRATTIALVASRLLGKSYSFTAHARDIYVDPILQEEKLTQANFVATCTAYNRDYLLRWMRNGEGEKVRCIYHGLDTGDYRPAPVPPSSSRPLLISVGQLREKKGFPYLLQACRLLKDWGYDFECQIIGDGPLYQALVNEIQQLRLEGVVKLCGMLAHPDVIQKYAQATLFVLPAVLAADGDRDGIPNVILEALAMNLPVVSTAHSGIPEVVEDGSNGLLVQPADSHALAKALAYLLDNPDLRQKFGARGRQTVIEKFDLQHNVGELLAEFECATVKRNRNVQ